MTYFIPFTEKELDNLIEAVDGAISEFETRRNPCTDWKELLNRLDKYRPAEK